MKIAVILALTIVAGCDLLGPSQPTLRSSAEFRGLRFDLVSLPSAAGAQVGLSGTNVTDERIVREMGTGCTFWPRLYRRGDLSRPVWDTARSSPNCAGRALLIDLAPGETISAEDWPFRFTFDRTLLADSLPSGEFLPGILLRPTGERSPSFVLLSAEAIRLSP